MNNECTKVQNPHHTDVIYFERIDLSINKNSALKSIIIEQCVGVLFLSVCDQICTCEFMDKTQQIAEEQLVMTMDKAQETKIRRCKS